MTQDLANKLIQHYQNCIIKIKEIGFFNELLEFCFKQNIQDGACCVAYINFKKLIIHNSWVLSKCDKNGVWCACPRDLHTTTEIINVCQKRIDILKTFKNEKS